MSQTDEELVDNGIFHMLGRRWTYTILRTIGMRNSVRFSELKRLLSGISGTVLSERLGQLEREGLVKRTVNAESSPPRVRYSLTESARELEAIIRRLVPGQADKKGFLYQQAEGYSATTV